MREFLSDGGFRDYYERYFLNTQDPGAVDVTTVTKPPPTFADKAMKLALAAVVVTITGVGGYAAYRYYKAHPEKFRKKAGKRVENPTNTKPPAAAPA